MEPMMKLTSHIAGKNATVLLFPDRVEWERKGALSTGAKATMGALTGGLSLLATGVRGSRDTEMVPVRAITHVGTRKAGIRWVEVVLTTPGGDVAMRCTRGEADEFSRVLRGLMLA